MQKYQDVVLKPTGDVVPGASVLVQSYPGGVTTTIYSDNSGTVVANPLTTDALGGFAFYAANGTYQLTISLAGVVTRIITGISLNDTSDVYVDDFGKLGVGNDANVLQAAIDAVQGTTAFLMIRPNTTIQLGASGVISVGAVRLVGIGGRDRTYITWTGTTMTAWAHTGNQTGGLQVDGVTMYGPLSCTAGGAISINGLGGVANSGSRFTNCAFVNGFRQLNMPQAHSWVVSGVTFTDYVAEGIHTQNTINQDEGDSFVTSCQFIASGANATGIFQAGAGGLKLVGNKIYGGKYGYWMDLAAGAVTSILIVESNSIEFQTHSGMRIQNTAGTGSFSQVVVDGNQFAGQPTPINFDDSSGFCVSAVISDNVIGCAAGAGTTAAITVTATPLTSVSNNVIYGSGSTVLGILIGVGSFSTEEDGNLIYGCVTQVSNSVSAGVASASSMALPGWTNAPIVTGATQIDNIDAGSARKGRFVCLQFQSNPLVKSTGNIKLVGGADFAATANDTLSLCCFDGTNWYEIGRAVI